MKGLIQLVLGGGMGMVGLLREKPRRGGESTRAGRGKWQMTPQSVARQNLNAPHRFSVNSGLPPFAGAILLRQDFGWTRRSGTVWGTAK